MRIAKDYERGLATSKAIGEQTAQKGSATAAAVQQTDGRAGAKPKRPEGAGFPGSSTRSMRRASGSRGNVPGAAARAKASSATRRARRCSAASAARRATLKRSAPPKPGRRAARRCSRPNGAGGRRGLRRGRGRRRLRGDAQHGRCVRPNAQDQRKITGSGSSFRYACLPDTGATRTVIAKNVAEEHGLRPVSRRPRHQDPRRKRGQHGLRRNGEHQYHLQDVYDAKR
jgi:hypothetical protein